MIRDNLEWTTPVSMVGKVQALYPETTPNQIHRAWTEMSQVLWKKDPVQLLSAKLLLNEHKDEVDLFQIEKIDGVEQLCWGMKRIAHRLRGKIVEIGIDATCKYTSLRFYI